MKMHSGEQSPVPAIRHNMQLVLLRDVYDSREWLFGGKLKFENSKIIKNGILAVENHCMIVLCMFISRSGVF